MADHYVKQQVGVADGTKQPPDKADGREVGGSVRLTLGSKVTGTAWANGDTIYLGKKHAGRKITSIKLCAGASLATSTIDVGVGGDPADGGTVETADKYVDGATLTVVDTPTELPLKASTLDDEPGDVEHLYATIGVADIAAGTELTFIIETVGVS